VVLLISLVGIYLALLIQFNNAIKPLLVFAAAPYDSQVEEAIDLLRLFASDLQLISWRQIPLEIVQFRLCGSEDFRCEHAGCWKAQD
jgi:hypothetical protein